MSALAFPINPGTFRHYFMVRAKPAQQPTTYGYTLADWATAVSRGTFWGSIEALDGQEFEAAQRRWSEAKFQVRMHFSDGQYIQTTDRLFWDGRTLEVLDSSDPPGDRRWWRLICSEVK